jgi:hypothetical protein
VVTTPVGLLHAATSVPNHLVSELQDLQPPLGMAVDLDIEDGAFVLGHSPGLGIQLDEELIAASRRRPTATPEGPHVRPEGAGRRLLSVAINGRAPQHHPTPLSSPLPSRPANHASRHAPHHAGVPLSHLPDERT